MCWSPWRNGAHGISATRGAVASAAAREATDAVECYGIFNMLASETAPLLVAKTHDGTFRTSLRTVRVVDSRATLQVTDAANAPPLWSKGVPWTDFPEGQWSLFELGPLEFDAGGCRSIAAILLSER
jgi:hypothetical protein